MFLRDKKGRFLKGNKSRFKKNLNENEVINLYQKYKSVNILAKIFNCSSEPIIRILSENNVKKYGFCGFSKENHPCTGKKMPEDLKKKLKDINYIKLDLEYVKKAYVEEEKSCEDIGKELGCNAETIRKRLINLGIKTRGFARTKRTKQKISHMERGEDFRNKISNTLKKKLKSGEIRNTMQENWLNEEFRKKITSKEFNKKRIEASLKGLFKRPTSYEKKISELCIENNLPFIYTGNGTFLIGYKNPDFINERDKIAIEVYHNYFKIREFGSCEEYERQKAEYFAKYGWKVIFINQEEITSDNWKEVCLKKINYG